MDKHTISTYGWIIIIVILLFAIIIAATPFGQRIISYVMGWMGNIQNKGDSIMTDILPLEAPQNINVIVGTNGDVLTFDESPNATGYTITVNGGEPFDSTSADVDITDKLNGLAGSVDITVTAYNEDKTSPTKRYKHWIPGLYETGSDYAILTKHWRQLLAENIVYVEDGAVYTMLDMDALNLYLTVPDLNLSSDELAGDLLLPHDGSITKLGNLNVETMEGNPAFSYCFYLTGIKIPDSVTTISDSAFMYCDALKKITIPSSVTSVGVGILANTAIEIADYQAPILPYGTFSGCHNLQSVTLSDDITEMGEEAFALCASLKNITLPKNVEIIHRAVFLQCEALENIRIPKTVTLIESNPFTQCSVLESITVESGNSTYACVNNCLIDIAAQTIITGCNTSAIPDSGAITQIGEGAFANLHSLTSITIPENIVRVGDSALVACENLTTIKIDNPNIILDNAAFASCNQLTHIYFNGTKAQWNAVQKGSNWNYNTGTYTVHCSDGNVNK